MMHGEDDVLRNILWPGLRIDLRMVENITGPVPDMNVAVSI